MILIAETIDVARVSFLTSMLEADGIQVDVQNHPHWNGVSQSYSTYQLFVAEADAPQARRLIEELDRAPPAEEPAEAFDDGASFSDAPNPPPLTWRNLAAIGFGLALCVVVGVLWWLRR